MQIKALSERNLQVGPRIHLSRMRSLVRDRAIADKLKELYSRECQICRFTIELPAHKRYSEQHHIQAKSRGGQDIASNLIVVCPNYHKILDYGMGSVQAANTDWTFTYQNQTAILSLNKHLGLL